MVSISTMLRLTVLLRTIVVLILLSAALSACGGDGGDSGGSKTPATSSQTPGATAGGGGGAGGSNVTLTIDDATAAVGEEANVILRALGVGDPGIGAWTVDVSFDASVASAVSCDGITGPGTPEPVAETPTPTGPGLTYCNPKYGDDTVRSTGAVAQGAPGDVSLATITFLCERTGTSDLTIAVDTFADAEIGEPTDINHTEENGTITCS
jgi:hypothetical protein